MSSSVAMALVTVLGISGIGTVTCLALPCTRQAVLRRRYRIGTRASG